MLWLVSSLLLAVHLIAVNLASGGPLVAAWLLGRNDDDARLAGRLNRWSLAALLLGSLAGAATLVLPGLGLPEALRRFSAQAYWFAGSELLFSAVCVAALAYAPRWFRGRPAATWIVALLTATNLLYHFPAWLAVIGRLAVDPAWGPPGLIERRELLHLMRTSEPLSLSVHFTLASIAVPAVAALWSMRRETNLQSEPRSEAAVNTVRGLAAWALVPTVMQLPVGAWVLAGATQPIRDAAMGGDLATAACFAGGVAAALYFTHMLAGLALGDVEPRTIRRAGWLLATTVVLMSATLRGARLAHKNQSPPSRLLVPPATAESPTASPAS